MAGDKGIIGLSEDSEFMEKKGLDEKMKQFMKKSFMFLLCAAVLLPLLIGMTAIEARADEGSREYVYFETFDELKEASKKSYPYGVSFQYDGDKALVIEESLELPEDGSLSAWQADITIPEGVTFTINSENYGSSIDSLTVNGTFKCYGWLNLYSKLAVNGKMELSSSLGLDSTVQFSGIENIKFTQEWCSVYVSASVESFEDLKAIVATASNDKSGLEYSISYWNYKGEALTIKESLTMPANCSLSAYSAEVIIPAGVTLTLKTEDSFSANSLTVKGTMKTNGYIGIGTKLDVQGKLTAGGDISLEKGATYSGLDNITFADDWNSVSCTVYAANWADLKDVISTAKNDKNGLTYEVYFYDYTAETVTIEENLTVPANCSLNLYGRNVVVPKDVTFTVKGDNYGISFGSLTVKGTFKSECHVSVQTNLDVQGKIEAEQVVSLNVGATYSGLENIEFSKDWGYVSVSCPVQNFAELKAAIDVAKQDKGAVRYDIYFNTSNNSKLTISEDLTVPENCIVTFGGMDVVVNKGVTFTVKDNNNNSFSCKTLTVKGTFNCEPYMNIQKKLDVQGKLNAGQNVALNAGATLKGKDKIKFVNGWGAVTYNHDVQSVSELKKAVSIAKEDKSGLQHNIHFYTSKAVSLSSSITVPKNANLMLYGTKAFTIPSGKKLTVKGTLDLGTDLVVKGTLVNDAVIYVSATNWNTNKAMTLKFSDGKYSGNGRLYVNGDKSTDKYTDVVKSLSKTNLEVTQTNDYNWTLRNVKGLKKLSKPTGLTWGKTMQYSWDAKKEEDNYTLTTRKGDFIWKAGSVKEKDADYQVYKICIYKDGKLFDQYTWSAGKTYTKKYDTMSSGISETSLKNGKYYFTVQAIAQGDDYCNSNVVKSDTWTYKKPDSKMKKASKLDWSWPTMEWSGPSGHKLYA